MEKVIEFLKGLSQPEKTDAQLEKIRDWTSERSMGNYDDCFEDGGDQMAACIALDAREILKGLGQD